MAERAEDEEVSVFEISDYLENEADIAAYLDAAVRETDDIRIVRERLDYVRSVLDDVARSRRFISNGGAGVRLLRKKLIERLSSLGK